MGILGVTIVAGYIALLVLYGYYYLAAADFQHDAGPVDPDLDELP